MTKLIFLLLLPFAFAQVDLHDDWVEEGDDFKLGDFKLTPVWTGHSAFITIDDMSVDVPVGECRKKRPFDICLDDTRITLDGEVVPDSINNDDTKTEMKLVVTGLLAELDLERTMSKNVLLINEEIDVTVSMHNNDQAIAEEVVYEEKYPSSVRIKDMEGCTLQDNDITWTGLIRQNNFITCKYTIEALTDKVFTTKAELEYFNGMEEEKTTDTERITILDYVLVSEMDTGSSKLTAGDLIELEIQLINEYDQILDVDNLQFNIPKAFKIIDRGVLDDKNRWKGTIDNGLNFSMVLQVIHTGSHEFNYTAKYSVIGVTQTVHDSKKFSIKPDVSVEIESDLPATRSGTPVNLAIEIFNPGPKQHYNIIATVISNLPGFENVKLRRDGLGAKNSYKVLDTQYETEYAGNYDINFSLQYENEFGEIFKESENYNLKISGGGSSSAPNEASLPATDTPEVESKRSFKLPSPNFDFGNIDTKSNALWLVVSVVIAALVLLILRYKIKND